MKVILVEDVKALGKKGEMVKAHDEKVAKEQLADARAFAEELAKAQVKVSVKVGEGGKVFGSVSSKEIAEAAKAQLGYDIDKKKIQMKDPIKAVGTTSVAIKLHPKVTAELKVVVEGI